MDGFKTRVESWDDFSPLKHVIVGRADHTCIPPRNRPQKPRFLKTVTCVECGDQDR